MPGWRKLEPCFAERARILGEIRKGWIRIDVAPGSFRLFIGSQPFTSLERERSGEIGTGDIFASLTNCFTILFSHSYSFEYRLLF